jgi:hypothetical protein
MSPLQLARILRSIAAVLVLGFALGAALWSCGSDAERDPDSEADCIHNGTPHEIGETYPAGDGCNSCMCTTSGSVCTLRACIDGGVDANPASCEASDGCPEGPACGTTCCRNGERCVNGACRCGSSAACGTGDLCEAVGPTGTDRCGAVCCGASGPCPGAP